jgi:hypothetical protein
MFDPGEGAKKDREVLKAEARRHLGLPEDAFIVGNGGQLIRRKRYDVFFETSVSSVPSFPTLLRHLRWWSPRERIEAASCTARNSFSRPLHRLGRRYEAVLRGLGRHSVQFGRRLLAPDADRGRLSRRSHSRLIALRRVGRVHSPWPQWLPTRSAHRAALARFIVQIADDPAQVEKLRRRALIDITRRYSKERGVAFYKEFFRLGGEAGFAPGSVAAHDHRPIHA